MHRKTEAEEWTNTCIRSQYRLAFLTKDNAGDSPDTDETLGLRNQSQHLAHFPDEVVRPSSSHHLHLSNTKLVLTRVNLCCCYNGYMGSTFAPAFVKVLQLCDIAVLGIRCLCSEGKTKTWPFRDPLARMACYSHVATPLKITWMRNYLYGMCRFPGE